MLKYHSTCLHISCVASLTKVTVSLNPEKNLRNGPPPPKISFFSFQNEFQANAKSVGAARRLEEVLARVGFSQLCRLTAAVCTELARVLAPQLEKCTRPPSGATAARIGCGCTEATATQPPTTLHCNTAETGGGCGCQRLRIQGIVEFIASYILSTYFALNFGLGWAAALCSSGRR